MTDRLNENQSENLNRKLVAQSLTEGTETVEGKLLTWKRWTLEAIQAGDCRVEPGAQFTLYSDGAKTWTCEISSGDTGDEWKNWFHILDSREVELFKTDRYYFNIGDKDHKHHWNDNRGANPGFAAHFAAAYYLSGICYC